MLRITPEGWRPSPQSGPDPHARRLHRSVRGRSCWRFPRRVRSLLAGEGQGRDPESLVDALGGRHEGQPFSSSNCRGGCARVEVAVRVLGWKEIYGSTTRRRRSSNLRVAWMRQPYCEWKCPLHNYIPTAGVCAKRAVRGRGTAHAPTRCRNLRPRVPAGPAVRRRLYARDRFESVTIGSLEKYIVDTAFQQGWPRTSPMFAPPAGASPSLAPGRPAWPAPTGWRAPHRGSRLRPYEQIGGLLTFASAFSSRKR